MTFEEAMFALLDGKKVRPIDDHLAWVIHWDENSQRFVHGPNYGFREEWVGGNWYHLSKWEIVNDS